MRLHHEDNRATVWHGDAIATLMQLPDDSVDALVTDPPYSSGGMTRGDRNVGVHAKYVNSDSVGGQALAGFEGDNRDQRAYALWSTLWMTEALRVVKPGRCIVVMTDWRQDDTTRDAMQAGGWVWRGVAVWAKPTARPQLGRFAAACEYAAWGSRGPLLVDDDSTCLPGFLVASSPREREHVTQKPLEVMRWLVRICPPGGVVLDPFSGSGTTGVAALTEGRRFVGIDSSAHWADVTTRRVREAQLAYAGPNEQPSLLSQLAVP